VARVPSWPGGPRAARFHRPVVAAPQERRPKRHRCPAGDRHHRRSPRPPVRAHGSTWSGQSREQSAPGLRRWRGRASFVVYLADAARAATGAAFDTGALGSADVRAVADQLAACAVSVLIGISADRGFLHTARHSPTFVNADADAVEDAYLLADAVEHADADAYVHGYSVKHGNLVEHGNPVEHANVLSAHPHAIDRADAVHAGPELAAVLSTRG
jgi:hypothetical protein